MGRKKTGNDDWLGVLILFGIGAIALYYAKAGRGSEQDAALLPKRLEDQIDAVVAALNAKFGKWW